jgi:ribosomal protein S18 acetylase RimI-like enzyme
MHKKIDFRPISEKDQTFLYSLYASTREDELAQTGWTNFEKENFLRQQFVAQHEFYKEQFSHAQFQIIQIENKAIGRLYIDHRKDEIRLIDIALLPEYRNQGIGNSLLKDIIKDATKAKKPVRIHVERYNPAMHLYERLGFVRIGDTGVYYLMEKVPVGADE